MLGAGEEKLSLGRDARMIAVPNRRHVMFRFVLIGVLLTATAHVAHGQSVKNAPVICVHGEGAWNPKDSVLTVITFSKGCDVATASRTYSWTKEDDEDFGGMVIAQTNLMTFASACLPTRNGKQHQGLRPNHAQSDRSLPTCGAR